MIGMDTPLFTPRSSGFETSSIPFVFSDGVLSFYSPSAGSTSDFDPSVSPPASSFSNASFLGVLPRSPRPSQPSPHPILQKLAIWHHNDEEEDHVYAETSYVTSPSVRETISFEDLDPSSTRYGAVRAHLTQISTTSCPVMHIFLPLVPFAPTIAEDPHSIDSVITISTPFRSPVRLMCAVYNRGTLVYSNNTAMTEEAPLHFGDAQYSTNLPHRFVDALCRDADGRYSKDEGMLDSIAVLLFMQRMDLAESCDEKVILVLVCDFEASQGSELSQARFSYLSPGTILSQNSSAHMKLPLTPPPSREGLSNVKNFALESIENSRRRIPRVLPKLSVAIPPPCHGKGRIQLYTDSPTPNHSPDIHLPPTPQSGARDNNFPVTPFPTALHQPEMYNSKVCSRAGHASILTESAYPFILTTASPSSSQSPAFGQPDSSRREEFEASRPNRSQTYMVATSSPLPSTPSRWFRF